MVWTEAMKVVIWRSVWLGRCVASAGCVQVMGYEDAGRIGAVNNDGVTSCWRVCCSSRSHSAGEPGGSYGSFCMALLPGVPAS